jgi:hypothetical protein
MEIRGIAALELLRGSATYTLLQRSQSIRVRRFHQTSPQYPNAMAMTCRRAVLRLENNDGSGEFYFFISYAVSY